MPKKIRIVIIDDHPLLRNGVASTLAAESAFKVVGQGGSLDQALQLSAEHLPDVILLDLNIEGGGINTARLLSSTYPDVKIIVLTVSMDEDDVLAALNAGVHGYVLKGVSGSELIRIIRQVCGGETYITPALATVLLLDTRQNVRAQAQFAALSPREHEILKCLAIGQANKQIAATLGLSEKTIKHYVTGIFSKLNVRNRLEAALLAREKLY
jgi:DNA-binding NarL/FixJ family response regulator